MIDKFKLPIALSLLGLVLIIGGVVSSGIGKQQPKQFPKESLVQSQKMIAVDVSGAVNTPGVYNLNDGDRIEEAIKAAGGFSDKANQEFISKNLNLAQKLTDGTKIYIPFEGESSTEAASGGQVAGVSTASTNIKININAASQSDLEALSGVGPVTATKIISGRPYGSVEELVNKKIISKSIYEKNKDIFVLY